MPPPAATIAPVATTAPDPAGPSRLGVLMITDNSDTQHPNNESGSIAAGTTANEALMDGFFQTVRTGASMTVDVRKVTGRATRPNPFNCDNIVREIKALPVNPGDAVMIYYAGHGLNIGTTDALVTAGTISSIAAPELRDRPLTEFPLLACGAQIVGSPNLDLIATWLAPKQPRLTIVMADACNSFYGGSGPSADTFVATSAAVPGPEARLRSLFRDATGTVLVAGAQRGHLSYYSADPTNRAVRLGGLLTLRFVDLFDRNVLRPDQRATWQDVGAQLKPMTVPVAGGGQDTQAPLLRVGAPFATAVPMPRRVSDVPAPDDAVITLAQAMQYAPQFRSVGKPEVEQVGGGTPTGPTLGPLPVPVPPPQTDIRRRSRADWSATGAGTLARPRLGQ